MNGSILRRLIDSRRAFLAIDELGPDSGATWRDLAEIEAFGFPLERHPLLGVACRGHVERLCPDQIEFDIATHLIGRRISVWNRVGSTNDIAAKAASSRSNEGLVVLAEEQSAGRGRRGRSWSAPARSSILMSVLLFPEERLAEPSWLTALGAVAAAEVVSERTGRSASIKWPNDVRLDGKKIAGVLVERRAGAVVGVGLNINIPRAEFPDELSSSATSLQEIVGSRVDRSEIARALIRSLDFHYEASRRGGASVLADSWRSRIEGVGETAEVMTPSGTIHGRVDQLDLLLGLVLEKPDGSFFTLPSSQILGIKLP